jgi:hypothetical protein
MINHKSKPAGTALIGDHGIRIKQNEWKKKWRFIHWEDVAASILRHVFRTNLVMLCSSHLSNQFEWYQWNLFSYQNEMTNMNILQVWGIAISGTALGSSAGLQHVCCKQLCISEDIAIHHWEIIVDPRINRDISLVIDNYFVPLWMVRTERIRQIFINHSQTVSLMRSKVKKVLIVSLTIYWSSTNAKASLNQYQRSILLRAFDLAEFKNILIIKIVPFSSFESFNCISLLNILES